MTTNNKSIPSSTSETSCDLDEADRLLEALIQAQQTVTTLLALTKAKFAQIGRPMPLIEWANRQH